MSYTIKEASPKRHEESRNIENVLVMQGGGSLGAFACGVFKALVKNKVQIDIVAGTSIGAVNAAIIAGNKSGHPEKDLEDFWVEIGESSLGVIPDFWVYGWDSRARKYMAKTISSASANAAFFGVPKMFIPRWQWWNTSKNFQGIMGGLEEQYFDPSNWTFMYDHTPLVKTLENYIDYNKLNLAATKEEMPSVLRLIITAVDVMTARPLIFDNTLMKIKPEHILASSGYPIYGFPWVDLGNNIKAWDGSLLSNTPIREVLYVSPRNDKNIFIVENYPQRIDRLPSNFIEVANRYKDILFCDKDIESIKYAKLVTRHIKLIEKLYDIFEQQVDHSNLSKKEINDIQNEYKNLIENYGAEIRSVTRIIRSEIESPSISKNSDFSSRTIRELIDQGERKTEEKLERRSSR
ncbi:patatin-like phospholipase family protein [Candidatus Nitrosocosmicus arcticus]|uniref:Putative transmembrane protein n=1 Tax=Candidatus Nitrosocosmicus arcticus TaxID=2035267 RepID=A0A557SUW0_9ARCH|nr:patatin-like phospholipase family protein [Candidatus Nitrosocosmicus arcticus]TVP40393.1 putative transmembrane protein [Candidatus Nitrosocosmicus arcticus]